MFKMRQIFPDGRVIYPDFRANCLNLQRKTCTFMQVHNWQND